MSAKNDATVEPEPLLLAIDDAFARPFTSSSRRHGRRPPTHPTSDDEVEEQADTLDESPALTIWERLCSIEVFLAIQFLCGAIVFLPGAQQYRGYVRALPYVASVGLLALYSTRKREGARPAATTALVSALALLVANLLHPTSQAFAGIAQCIFQLSIAAPLFWSHKLVRSMRHLERIVLLVFVLNFASAGLGLLQVYWPGQFMPPEFSSLGLRLNQDYVAGLTYIGSDGREIVRPPGLSDQPGGAAIAGALTALSGLGLLLWVRRPTTVIGVVAAMAIGLAAIYLAQVRSILLVSIGAGLVMCVVAFRRGRGAAAAGLLAAGAGIVVASFVWATTVGGTAVEKRFMGLQGTGALQAYQENRGNFLSHTAGELLDRYPLGAGLGRWGMMNVYFGDPADVRTSAIYVEIQPTGWLLDGGILMWVLYGGAVLLSMWSSFRFSASRDPAFSSIAMLILAAQLFVAAMSFAGPVFNTQLGIVFWTLTSVLHGAARFESDRPRLH